MGVEKLTPMLAVVAVGGGVVPAVTTMVNDWLNVETAPSWSVMVALAVPVTGDALTARPTMVTLPSALSTALKEGSGVIENEALEIAPPLGVIPSARSGMMVPVEDCPTARVRLFMMISPEKLTDMDWVRVLGVNSRRIARSSWRIS